MTAPALVQVVPEAVPRVHPDDPFGAFVPRRPSLRPSVRRPRLLASLVGPGTPPYVVIVAPAGYGKTMLLCDWCAHDPRPFAWVTLHRGLDDPRALRRSISLALDSAEADDVVLVLDDVHVLRSGAARDVIASVASQPPPGLTVALASRTDPPLPMPRLRMQGLLAEVRAADLAMTRPEAAALLRAAGLRFAASDLDALLRRTEGWPAGLSLAARALAAQGATALGLARVGGADRLVADYVREEVLDPLTDDERCFVTQTSALDVLTAPLCDAVLGQSGSADLLRRLGRTGFPLVALDRTGERFRHHRLLAEMLRAELRRGDPALETRLHRRAGRWHARAGDRERALGHALAADDLGTAAELVWDAVPEASERGCSATLEHGLGRFTAEQIAADPLLAITAAGTHLAHGRADVADHWTRTAAASASRREGTAGAVSAVLALLGRDGLAGIAAESARVARLLAPDSPGQALAALLAGAVAHLTGDRTAARSRLEDGARRAAVPAPLVAALCLSQLALLALDEHDLEAAERLSARARAQVARHGLARLETSALVLAVSALVRAQRGRIDEADADAREAHDLIERVVDVAAWYELEVRIALARATLRLSDLNAARAHAAAARRIACREPDAIVAREWLEALEAELASCSEAPAKLVAPLTTAELRILQFLPTHLSFREIAERTYVSANTVKTQANAVYRKLDVRSRSEAVGCARGLGLLD